jgi:hypothetical protein
MTASNGLQVTVTGELPEDVLSRISAAVQKAVREEVAKLDLLRSWTESDPVIEDSAPLAHRPIMGIIFKPPASPAPHGGPAI